MRAKFRHKFLPPATQTGLSLRLIITIVIMLKLWPAAGCEAKVAPKLSYRS